MEERNYWLGFSAVPGMGPARFGKLLAEFKNAKTAWEAPREAPRPGLAKLGLAKLLGEEGAGKFEEFRKKFLIEDYLKELKEKDVWFITLQDKEYPQLLREIKNPPFVLYGKGSVEILTNFARQPRVSDDARLKNSEDQSLNSASLSKSRHQTGIQPTFNSSESGLLRLGTCSIIAVVGARKTTQYGREVTKLLTQELVLAGFTIVSGLALGVDAVSHMTALENSGKTIAVLGSGVDYCSPTENISIYNNILKSGNCIISEFPLGMKPAKWSFPARNRIIAGLSQAVLVTEGAEDSGSLITAEFALKFGRKVFAVPGPITSSMSKGPYKLISRGAKLVTSGEDILKELKSEIRNSKSETISKSKIQKGGTGEEQAILDLLQNEPLHFDELVRRTKLNSSQLSSTLSIMEIKGMVKNLGGGIFSI